MDWVALLRAGVVGLRLSPDDFWGLTPAELKMLLGDPQSSGPLLSTGLDALMAAYPDKVEEGE